MERTGRETDSKKRVLTLNQGIFGFRLTRTRVLLQPASPTSPTSPTPASLPHDWGWGGSSYFVAWSARKTWCTRRGGLGWGGVAWGAVGWSERWGEVKVVQNGCGMG